MLLDSLTKHPSISVNRGSHFQVHFVWQVWDGQLSPAFKSIRLKAFGGWKFDRGTTKLHARILRGKGVQKKKPNMFTVGSSTSATLVLPVYLKNIPRGYMNRRGYDRTRPLPATQNQRGVQPSPWQCRLSHACHEKATGRAPKTKGRQRDTGAYTRPLGSAHCPTPATQKPTGRTSEPLAVHIVPRAYIRPLGSAHCPTPATQKPTGLTAEPLAVHVVPRLPRKTNRAYIRAFGSAHCPTPATQKPPATKSVSV